MNQASPKIEKPEVGTPPENPVKEKQTPLPDTIRPEIEERPESDNTARPPGDWQVEPDPMQPPGVEKIW
jgi:hypothetical protein